MRSKCFTAGLTIWPQCIYLELWPSGFQGTEVFWWKTNAFFGKMCLHFIVCSVATNMKFKSAHTMSDEMFRFYFESKRMFMQHLSAQHISPSCFTICFPQYLFNRTGNKIIKGKLSYEHQHRQQWLRKVTKHKS